MSDSKEVYFECPDCGSWNKLEIKIVRIEKHSDKRREK